MRKLVFLVSICAMAFFALPQQAQAQYYQTAIGARLGSPLAASFKHFLSEDGAVEAFAGFRGYSTYSWVVAGAAYQIHKPIDAVDGLQWYFGGGVAIYFWTFDNIFVGDRSTNTSFALQGYLGLDYTFSDAPVNLSVDWVPTFWLNGFGSGFGGGFGALAVRYVLNQ